MTSRRALALAILALAAVACDTGSRIFGLGGSANSAVLRIVNTTDVAIDLMSHGVAIGGSGHVPPRTASACIRVDPANSTLRLRESGAASDLGDFTPVFAAEAAYSVIAFTSDLGTTRTLTLADDFTPTSGLAGLRIVDVAPGVGSVDIYVTPPGEPLGVPTAPSIGFGGTTGFFDANPGSSQVRFTYATTRTLVLDAGLINLLPGHLSTMVLAQPAGATTVPEATLVPAC